MMANRTPAPFFPVPPKEYSPAYLQRILQDFRTYVTRMENPSKVDIPAWNVGMTNNQTVTTPNTYVKIGFDSTTETIENFAPKGGIVFNTTDHNITVPKTGLYQVNMFARVDGLNASYFAVLRMYLNESNTGIYIINDGTSNSYRSLGGSVTLSLSEGDVLDVRIYGETDTNYEIEDIGTGFSGYFIG